MARNAQNSFDPPPQKKKSLLSAIYSAGSPKETHSHVFARFIAVTLAGRAHLREKVSKLKCNPKYDLN